MLLPEQRIFFNLITNHVAGGPLSLFCHIFLDAPGGTGKTFLMNLLLAQLCKDKVVALAVASSEITATLLCGGRTAHSVFKLPLNLASEEINQEEESESGLFAQTLLEVGEGRMPTDTNGQITFENIFNNVVNSEDNLISKVFPSLQENLANKERLCERATTAPKNEFVGNINKPILELARAVMTTDDATIYHVEFLNSLDLSGVPFHKLELKVGVHNLDAPRLCNGTRIHKMCSGFVCGLVTIVIGAALVISSSIVGFVVVPNIVKEGIVNQVALMDDTIQLERFTEVPFPLQCRVRVFNISNAAEVLEGAVPIVTEMGPYVYKLYSSRLIEERTDDRLRYRKLDRFEFDAVASFPYTENDIVHVANTPFHGVLQVAERRFPGVMTVLNEALPEIFEEYNKPIVPVRVRDLIFDGMPLCRNPSYVGTLACIIIRQISNDIQNMMPQPDGSIHFSVLNYRNGIPGGLMDVYRGLDDPADLGRIINWQSSPNLSYWTGANSLCNMLNGTDSGIFQPFINREHPLYVFNSDICRSVELRYQHDIVHNDIPGVRFAAREWLLNNNEGCFCLNITSGINAEDGCLLNGAMELFSCVGAYMVLSNPHFLFGDIRYRNGVFGMNPVIDKHGIFLDIEPNTGTILRGSKRAQFNVFMRPVTRVHATQKLRTTLTPIFWIEEAMTLPEEYTDEISTQLLSRLDLIAILVPVIVAICGVVLLIGIILAACVRLRKSAESDILTNSSD
ncbi:hypothetical protein evm_002189 [Chilo suppressalis]|nr:hypothetical protein evm_002189 [Chilo suppressalis]